MTTFIPIFPLNLVVFPGEALNLHIFEPRYKQLIRECVAEQKQFGIPPVLEGQMGELGTSMEVLEIAREYDNGELDIRTRGVDVFRILEVVRELPDKLYSGAIANFPDNEKRTSSERMAALITSEVKRLYELMDVAEKFPQDKTAMLSYEIGHYVGFSKAQEYEMLGLFNELQRLEYIRRHLNNMVPLVQELEEMKKRIQANGHFKNISSDF